MTPRIATVMLVLPLFYGHARRIREGILGYVEQAAGNWRLVESNQEQAEARPEIFGQVDGVIAWSSPRTAWMKALDTCGMPVVNCGDGPADDTGISVVTTDWESLARLAVAHFRALGLDTCSYIGREIGSNGQLHPRAGQWQQITREAGMEGHLYEMQESAWPGNTPTAQEPALAAFLRSLPKPCGILCEDDPAAVRVVQLAQEALLRVPGDLAVVGQGNRLIGRTGRPAISTIVPPGMEIGLKAAEILAARLAGELPPGGSWRIPCTDLLVRESSQSTGADPALERAWRLFERRAMEGVTVQELAAAAGLSTKTLVRRFAARFGIDPAGEVRRRRFEQASRLLEETDLEISEIGRRCGFPSPSNFFNFFHRHAACSPSEFRKTFSR